MERIANTLFYWYPICEKMWLVLDIFQIYTLLWNASQAWSYPYLWVKWTRFLVWSCLDYFSMTDMGALLGRSNYLNLSKWGQMSYYLSYSLNFALFPIYCILCHYALIHYIFTSRSRNIASRDLLLAHSLLWAQVMYLPICLATFRLYYCELTINGWTLAADPSISCGATDHIVYTLFSSLFALPVYFYLPFMLYRLASGHVVYQSSDDHEKRLVAYEILYMLDIDNHYIATQRWLTGSFNRIGSKFHYYTILLKAILLFIFVFFRFNLMLQAALFWLALLFYGIYAVFVFPFRLLSSNVALVSCYCALLTNFTYGLVNASGLQSALTIGSYQSVLLVVMNSLCFFICVLAFATDIFSTTKVWPSLLALDRINTGPILDVVSIWIITLRKSKSIRLDCLAQPNETLDIIELEETCRELRRCWLQAKSYASIFEVMLCDSLDAFLLLHAERGGKAIRKNDHWDNALIETASTFKTKKNLYILMNPTKRRILYKLLALRYLKGDRKIAKFHVHKRSLIQRCNDETERVLGMNPLELKDEHQNLNDIYDNWHELITTYEADEEYMQASFSATEVESWYAYRARVFELIQSINLSSDEESSDDGNISFARPIALEG